MHYYYWVVDLLIKSRIPVLSKKNSNMLRKQVWFSDTKWTWVNCWLWVMIYIFLNYEIWKNYFEMTRSLILSFFKLFLAWKQLQQLWSFQISKWGHFPRMFECRSHLPRTKLLCFLKNIWKEPCFKESTKILFIVLSFLPKGQHPLNFFFFCSVKVNMERWWLVCLCKYYWAVIYKK